MDSSAGQHSAPPQQPAPPPQPTAEPATAPPDPRAIVRSRAYVVALVLAALVGAPIAAVAYGFLEVGAVGRGQRFQRGMPAGEGYRRQPGHV